MRDVGRQDALLYCSRRRAEPPGARPPAAATTDLALIAEQIDRIAALVAAGSHYDAREACANLVFDFQPLIVARPELFQRVAVALARCDGHQLLRRLVGAGHGDTA